MKKYDAIISEMNERGNTKKAKEKIKKIYTQAKKELEKINKKYKSLGLPLTNWVIIEWPIELLSIDIDAYQRQTRTNTVDNIVAKYNPGKLDIKCVSIRDGKAYVMDGAHSCIGLSLLGFPTIICKTFIDLTKEEEADLFARQDEGKTRLNSIEQYRAELTAKHKDCMEIDALLKEKGLTVSFVIRKPIRRNINAIKILRSIYNKWGISGVDLTTQIIIDASWDEFDAGFSLQYLRIGKTLCEFSDKIGDKNYKIVLDSMKKAGNPALWEAWALEDYKDKKGMHASEMAIQNYVRKLCKVIK